MISVAQAEKIILGAAKLLPMEACNITQASGRLLREDIKTDRPQPPFDKALMDGIAISFKAWQEGLRCFTIEGVIAAGETQARLNDQSNCFRIMTGAVIPKNCDCVIPIEHLRIDGDKASLNDGVITLGQFIRTKSADATKGKMILRKGIRLEPPHIGVAVSLGKSYLKVSTQPKIAIIATGNELVDLGKPIKMYQTRLSNSYALHSLFVQSGLAKADTLHLPDDQKILCSKISKILSHYDMIVLSGGVSMGDFDYVPEVLNTLGVRNLFHKVAQKPGKPFWFGISKTGKAIFALPGNPVSTLICAYRYVVPYLMKCAGEVPVQKNLILKQLPSLKSDITHFLPVKGDCLVSGGGSGDFGSLAETDGFIEYDSHEQKSEWPYFSWRT